MPTTLSGCFIGGIPFPEGAPRCRWGCHSLPLGAVLYETEDVAVRITEQRHRHDARNLSNGHHHRAAQALRLVQIGLQVIHLGVERHTLRALTWPDGAVDALARSRIHQA